MKTEDILKLTSDDVSRLTLSELKSLTQQLIHVEQVRINRLQKLGINTPAVESFNKVKSKMYTQGKTLNELRATFYQARYQLGLKTSTVSGAKKVAKALNTRLGGDSEAIDIHKFWDVYNKYQEANGITFKYTGDSEKIQRMLYQLMVDNAEMDFDDLMTEFSERLTKLYEDDENYDKINDLFD